MTPQRPLQFGLKSLFRLSALVAIVAALWTTFNDIRPFIILICCLAVPLVWLTISPLTRNSGD